MVLYSVAAMFLLIRFHALDEQAEWLRRRIGDPTAISGHLPARRLDLHRRSRSSGRCLLTTVAASAPLAGAWDGVSDNVVEVSRSLAKFLPGGANSRNLGSEFGDDTQIRGFWVDDDRVYATIEMSPDEDDDFYWRACTFDTFNNNGLGPRRRRPRSRSRPTSRCSTGRWRTWRNGPDPAGDVHGHAGRVQGRVHALAATARPVSQTAGAAGHRRRAACSWPLKRSSSPSPYTVTARRADPRRGRARGEPAHRGRHRLSRRDPGHVPAGPGGRDGPRQPDAPGGDGRAAPNGAASSPYELAKTMETQFRRDDLVQVQHRTSRDLPCAEQNLSTVECFATYKEGLLPVLRDDDGHLPARAGDPGPDRRGLPARATATSAPASRRSSVATATPVGRGVLPGLRLGPVRPDRWRCLAARAAADRGAAGERTPRPSSSVAPGGTAFPPGTRATRGRPVSAACDRAAGRRPGCSVAVAVLLAAAVGGLMFMAWRRGPRGRDIAGSAPTARSPGWRPGSASARGPTRPSTNTPGRWPRSCPRPGRSSRRSPRPRSRSTYGRGSSARTGCTRCARPSAACGSCCSACSFRRGRRPPPLIAAGRSPRTPGLGRGRPAP